MASNYKRLGDYILQVDVRNTDESLGKEDLYGLSVYKEFIPTHANLVGVNFNGYKVVAPGKFTYIPDTSRRGDKIAIGLNGFGKDIIVSSVYTVFEIFKPEELNAEYLMMLFRNPEFDRYARYNSWGSAREVFSWEDFCDSELYIPNIDEQRKIVRQYKEIMDRIRILEETDSKVLDLIRVYLGENLKEETETVSVVDFCINVQSGGTPSRTNESYWDSKDIPWVKNGEVKNNIIVDSEEYISKRGLSGSSAKLISKGSVLMAMYCVSTPQLSILDIDVATNQAVCCMTLDSDLKSIYLYYYLMFFGDDLTKQANGAAQQNLNQEQIKNYEIKAPNSIDDELMLKVHSIRPIIAREIMALKNLSESIIANIF